MTTTVQIPVDLGGTNVPYNDGTGAYGMAAQNGYGCSQYFFPMISEVMAAMATRLTQAATAGSTAGATAGAAAAEPFAEAAAESADEAAASAAAALASQQAAATSATDADADAVATAADRLATAANLADINAASAIILGYANTAQAQAGLAASSAASASSVAQQDLSGVTAAALHRSPNAVVAMYVYDTSKDSDGGAWVERCSHLSWANEALNGTWLAPTSPAGFLTELDARSRGATLGTEVSPDPTFSSSAGWTLNGSASIGSNTLTAASVGTGNAIATRSDPVGGNLALATAYQVTVVVGTLTAGAIQVRLGNTGTTLRTLSSAGTHTFTVNPGATGANMSLYASGTTSGTVTRFSIKPVTANVTATGDYFQLATDGKFYSLSAGSGTTEVFRGNKAKFPRLAAIVLEATSLTTSVYDLTEPGRPLWARWSFSGTLAALTGVDASQGQIRVASTSGLVILDLARDRFRWHQSGNDRVVPSLTNHTSPSTGIVTHYPWSLIVSNTVNAVAACVMPDAPVDPVTGLQVPTIACATGGGISIIQNDGTVRNSSNTGAFAKVAVSPRMLIATPSGSAAFSYALNPGALGAAFAITTPAASAAPGFTLNNGVSTGDTLLLGARGAAAIRQGARLTLTRMSEAAFAQSLVSYIAPDYATGWWCGDIRRVWCADTVAGAVSAGEKINEPSFDAQGNWLFGTVGSATAATIGAGQVNLPRTDGSNYSYVYQTITLEANKTYTLTVLNGGAVSITALVGTAALGSTLGTLGINAGAAGVLSVTASQASVVVTIRCANDGATGVATSANVVEAVLDRCYKAKPATIYGTLTRTAVASGAQLVAYSGFSASNYIQEPYSADLDPGLAAVTTTAWVNYTTAVASTIIERAAASGARIVLGTDGTGKLTATAYDGTTTRTVTTTAAYNTGTWLKARASYTLDGTLSISVNGRIVAQTTGTPLLTLSNASAVATIGNDRTLATPFPGSICLVKWGATVPSAEAMLWMYEQEKQMFQAGAQVTLPDSGSLVDVAYDDLYDRITVVSAANESNFTGLVRTSTAAVPAGAYTKAARGSGVKLLARSTTNIGVDVTIPSQNLKEELLRRAEDLRRARVPVTFDYVGGFTGNTTNGGTAIASVTGLSVPAGVNLRGVTVTGTGIPASTVITDIVGATIYVSKPATATNTGVSISMLEFPLPTGYEADAVATAGALKQEGSTKDWTRGFDGFVERVVYGAAPGATAWVQARARRMS